MLVRDILIKWLKENGYDGLCNDLCGCGLEDLICCCDYCAECEPAYVHHNCELEDGSKGDLYFPSKSRPTPEEKK